MEKEDFMARMNLTTYRKLRRYFKPISPEETARSYFIRLAEKLRNEN